VVVEEIEETIQKYSVALRKPAKALAAVSETLSRQVFTSARAALIETERSCNRAIVQSRATEH
jgi:hypothetical protein